MREWIPEMTYHAAPRFSDSSEQPVQKINFHVDDKWPIYDEVQKDDYMIGYGVNKEKDLRDIRRGQHVFCSGLQAIMALHTDIQVWRQATETYGLPWLPRIPVTGAPSHEPKVFKTQPDDAQTISKINPSGNVGGGCGLADSLADIPSLTDGEKQTTPDMFAGDNDRKHTTETPGTSSSSDGIATARGLQRGDIIMAKSGGTQNCEDAAGGNQNRDEQEEPEFPEETKDPDQPMTRGKRS
jgi:hypothetical protein